MSIARKIITGDAGGSADPGDPDFANVSLLLNGDGNNGANNNTFTDSSNNNFTVTRAGGVTQGSFSPYGDNWSNYFGGDRDYLFLPSSTNFAFGTGDFTIEHWVFGGAQSDNYPRTIAIGPTFSEGAVGTIFDDTYDPGKLSFYARNLSSGRILVSTSDINDNAWHHVAITRSLGVFRLFVDGVLEDTNSTYTISSVGTAAQSCVIGSVSIELSGENFQGYISDVRIIKGMAIYTSDFTPPTEPLTAISNTTLLTCQSSSFKDNSLNDYPVTLAGTPKVTPFSPYATSEPLDMTTDGGSGYFEGGAANVLSVPSNTNLDLSTGDFTVEMWVYLNSKIDDSKLYIDITNGSNYWQFKYASSYGWSLQRSPYAAWVVNNGSASNVNTGEWQHVALTRSRDNFTIWQNGESFATGTHSGGIGTYNTKSIGGWSGSSGLTIDGYISDFRLTKGTALYSSSFTPPTSPISAGANTELLLNFQDAGIYDYAGINNLDTAGNAQIDTAVVKYGTGSLEFDGTGDYLELRNNIYPLDFGTGDFTVECWFYAKALTAGVFTALFGFHDRSNSGWAAYVRQDGVFILSSGDTLTGGGNISTSTWHHFAATRSGSTVRVFLNGTQVDTDTVSESYSSMDEPFRVGIDNNRDQDNAYFNGYIDDLRITKGIARYTADFTPPTEALPTY